MPTAVTGLDAEDAADTGAGGAPEKPKFIYEGEVAGGKVDTAPAEIGIGSEVPGTNGSLFKEVTTKGDEKSGNPPQYSHVKLHYKGLKIHKGKWAVFDASRTNMNGLPDKDKAGRPVHIKNAAGEDLWKRTEDDEEGTPDKSSAMSNKQGPVGLYVDKKFEFKTGCKEVIKGWDVAVGTMTKGEKATFVIRADLAYGERGDVGTCDADEIKKNATLKYEVELFDWEEGEAPPPPPGPPPGAKSGGCEIL